MTDSQIKTKSLLICLGSYMITLLFCLLFYLVTDTGKPILNAAILDLMGTILIFIVSYSFNNSSFYDPYWSIAPVPILIYWIISAGEEVNPRQMIILTIVLIWSVRLTLNWIRRWKGLRDEDWRYIHFRTKFPNTYWIVSFLGIHLLPTIVVFLGCLAAYPALVYKTGNLDLFDLLAIVIATGAIIYETVADEQLKNYLKESVNNSFLKTGLWRYSRHPNYFGEVLFWVGIFIFSTGDRTFYWWTLAGPVVMILMFQFISVPMIDRRMLERKTGYDRYMKVTSGWIPWLAKRK